MQDWILGTRIIMDEAKIKREGIYPLEKIYEKIDYIAKYVGMIKENKNLYYAEENQHSLAKLSIFTHNILLEEEWFTKNVKEWFYIDKEDKEYNLIENAKKENWGVWE